MPISEKDVSEARQAWGEGLIEISKIFEADGIKKAHSLASKLLDDLYGFDLGSVLFKPTLSGGKKTFRNDKEGTLSYFVGHNPKFPNDSGFGLKYWREVQFDTANIFGFLAIVLAAINIFGGFLVTQRMLAMYKKKQKNK